MNHANGRAAIRTDSFSRARAGRPEHILETSDFDHAAVGHDFWFVVEEYTTAVRTQAPPRSSFWHLFRSNCSCRLAWTSLTRGSVVRGAVKCLPPCSAGGDAWHRVEVLNDPDSALCHERHVRNARKASQRVHGDRYTEGKTAKLGFIAPDRVCIHSLLGGSHAISKNTKHN